MKETLPIIDEANGIIKSVRLQSPSHFVWKIKSYSKLVELEWKKIESSDFEVNGHKWKLTFYPDGDHERKGKGYISLYLSLMDAEDHLPLSLDLFVKFQFLVFDQINDKYLVIQGINNDVCRFQRMKTEWGFARLLSLVDFKDSSNGYLLDDCCVFGVDVFVNENATCGDSFSVKPLKSGNSYTFKINNFSTLSEGDVESEVFTIDGLQWKLKFYPRGSSKPEVPHVSLFLMPKFNKKVHATYKLRMIDQVHGNNFETTPLEYGFHGKAGFGFVEFVALVDVKNPSKGYLLNDAIVVEVEIDYVSVVNELS
ncbi:hypothetical protein ACFE04_009874 [Oxalis oulophora]